VIKIARELATQLDMSEAGAMLTKAGRCRLTVSHPELKARLVSALETKM
jgi:hypothetical protein